MPAANRPAANRKMLYSISHLLTRPATDLVSVDAVRKDGGSKPARLMVHVLAVLQYLQKVRAYGVIWRGWIKAILGFALVIMTMPIICASPVQAQEKVYLLHVSYDATRGFYQDYNQLFAEYWHQKNGQQVRVRMSHGASGKQTRFILDGLEADIISLALAGDMDMITRHTDLITTQWRNRYPFQSTPYRSTIVFVVRKGNPKSIKGFDDMTKGDIQIITANPKTSGAARWGYLAVWYHALEKFNGDEKAAQSFVRDFYASVPVFETGSRGATTTFVRRGIGDVLVSWENEAFLILEKFPDENFEIITPHTSIEAQPIITHISAYIQKHGVSDIATAYISYLYEPPAQALVASHYFRPVHPDYARREDMARFAKVELYSLRDKETSWRRVHQKHFAKGAFFDQIIDQVMQP